MSALAAQFGRLRGVLSMDFDLNALSDFVAGLSVAPAE
jgi:hypothetical protein